MSIIGTCPRIPSAPSVRAVRFEAVVAADQATFCTMRPRDFRPTESCVYNQMQGLLTVTTPGWDY